VLNGCCSDSKQPQGQHGGALFKALQPEVQHQMLEMLAGKQLADSSTMS